MKKSPEAKTAIQKIVLQIGRKTLELSPAEAKDLHGILDELYGDKVVRHTWPQWYYQSTPTITPYWQITTCGSTGSTGANGSTTGALNTDASVLYLSSTNTE